MDEYFTFTYVCTLYSLLYCFARCVRMPGGTGRARTCDFINPIATPLCCPIITYSFIEVDADTIMKRYITVTLLKDKSMTCLLCGKTLKGLQTKFCCRKHMLTYNNCNIQSYKSQKIRAELRKHACI